jgi:uncharacterized protein (TIRG00374 family)
MMGSSVKLFKRTQWSALIGAGISVTLLFLALRNVQWAASLSALRDAEPEFLLLAELLLLVSFWLRAVRWKYLLKPLGEFASTRLFQPILIGFFSNFILPARSGELVRVVALGTNVPISKSAILASIAVERVLDGIALALFLMLGLWWVPAPPWVAAVLRTTALVFGAALLLLGLLAFEGQRIHRMAGHLIGGSQILLGNEFLSHTAKRLGSLSSAFLEGLRALRSGSLMGGAVLLSLVTWFASIVSYALVARALGIDLSLAVFFIFVATVNLSVFITVIPGHVGLLEFLGVSLLGLFGVSESRALVFVILLRLVTLGPLMVGGLFFSRTGISLLERQGDRP